MAIVSSTYEIGPTQVDGRAYVTEIHVAEGGQEYSYEYLSDSSTTPQMVMEQRAEVINNTLAQREASRIAVQGTSVPLTRFEFLNRFTAQERVAVRERSKTDPYTEDFMDLMKTSGNVSLVLARGGLAYLVSAGVLTAERAAVIGAE